MSSKMFNLFILEKAIKNTRGRIHGLESEYSEAITSANRSGGARRVLWLDLSVQLLKKQDMLIKRNANQIFILNSWKSL